MEVTLLPSRSIPLLDSAQRCKSLPVHVLDDSAMPGLPTLPHVRHLPLGRCRVMEGMMRSSVGGPPGASDVIQTWLLLQPPTGLDKSQWSSVTEMGSGPGRSVQPGQSPQPGFDSPGKHPQFSVSAKPWPWAEYPAAHAAWNAPVVEL